MTARKVRITTGPHGRHTTIEIDGEPVPGACGFTLTSNVHEATTLAITYNNVDVEVEALVETSGFEAKHKQYERVMLRTVEEARNLELFAETETAS